MSDLYKTIMSLCDSKGISGYRLCKSVGIQPSILTDLKMGRQSGLSAQNADKIASFFGITVSQLLNSAVDNPVVYCADCGLHYNAQDPEEVVQHTDRHIAWQKAVDKYGFCWPYAFREEKKSAARSDIASGTLTDDEYVDAQINIFKALFSRSLEGCGYDLRHAKFEDYVAMILNQDTWKNELPLSVYMKISTRFGVRSGMPSGSYYQIKKAPTQAGERSISDDDIMFALWGDVTDIDEEDLEDVKRYAAFVRERKKKK